MEKVYKRIFTIQVFCLIGIALANIIYGILTTFCGATANEILITLITVLFAILDAIVSIIYFIIKQKQVKKEKNNYA